MQHFSSASMAYTSKPICYNLHFAQPTLTTVCFRDLAKLNLLMVIRFWARANFWYCPSCLKKIKLASKVVKVDSKIIISLPKILIPETHCSKPICYNLHFAQPSLTNSPEFGLVWTSSWRIVCTAGTYRLWKHPPPHFLTKVLSFLWTFLKGWLTTLFLVIYKSIDVIRKSSKIFNYFINYQLF
jgi:hypothetical protein